MLAKHFLFSELDAGELDQILSFATERSYAAGRTIFERGDPGGSLMAVLEGGVRIGIYSEGGKEVTLGFIARGDLFGEIALIDGKGRTANATAVGACRLLVVDQRDFLPFLERHPRFAVRLLQILCARMRKATDVHEGLAFQGVPTRLARLLVQMAELHGEPTKAGRRITLKLSQQEIGNLIAATRESVNKQLKLWEADGLLGLERGHIILRDPDEMRLLGEGAE